jgi:hypothetical protein
VTSADFIIASFPRSGNTWLRLLVADILEQRAGLPTGTRLPIPIDRVIPDLDADPVTDIDPRIDLGFRLLKTHDRYQPTQPRAVYVVRRPDDALVSYYYFHRRYPHLQKVAKAGPDSFVRRHATDWLAHVRSYLAGVGRGAPILVLTYEQMQEDAASALRRVMASIGVQATSGEVQRAAAHHEFGRRRALEAQTQASVEPDQYFYRVGAVGTGQRELGDETTAFIQERLFPAYEAAARCAANS